MAKINVYACGGMGSNVAFNHFEDNRGSEQTGFAVLNPIYIDSSRSNLRNNVDDANCFFIPGADGGGKRRDTLHADIKKYMPQIMLKFDPAEMNIVIHSCSGGSGAVIGQLTVEAIMEQNKPVIVFMVGTTNSLVEIENTYKQIKSYDILARNKGVPVAGLYLENDLDGSARKVDERIAQTVISLAALYSGENHGLDTQDLKNWLAYTNTPNNKFPAKLVSFDMFQQAIELDPAYKVISLTSLTSGDISARPNIPVHYQATGIVGDEAAKHINIQMPIHFVLYDGYFAEVLPRLEKHLKDAERENKARIDVCLASVDDASQCEGNMLL